MRRLRPLALLAAACAVLAAGAATAGQPVTLRAAIVDADGRVTLGELFDNAGAAESVLVAQRTGPTVVLDAVAVQQLAARYGLDWGNPRGIHRIIVRSGVAAPAGNTNILTYARNLSAGEQVQAQDVVWTKAAAAPGGAARDVDAVIGMVARRPLRQGDAVEQNDVSSPMVIKGGEMVVVSYDSDGVSVSLQGKSLGSAAVGDTIAILNTASKKVIEAVATGPDQAVVGPEAERIRADRNPSQLASR